MKHHHQSIQLDTPTQSRVVKRLARSAFIGVRLAAQALAQLPVIAKHTTLDIVEAWQESAHPKS